MENLKIYDLIKYRGIIYFVKSIETDYVLNRITISISDWYIIKELRHDLYEKYDWEYTFDDLFAKYFKYNNKN